MTKSIIRATRRPVRFYVIGTRDATRRYQNLQSHNLLVYVSNQSECAKLIYVNQIDLDKLAVSPPQEQQCQNMNRACDLCTVDMQIDTKQTDLFSSYHVQV
jgi:hypothetical protein